MQPSGGGHPFDSTIPDEKLTKNDDKHEPMSQSVMSIMHHSRDLIETLCSVKGLERRAQSMLTKKKPSARPLLPSRVTQASLHKLSKSAWVVLMSVRCQSSKLEPQTDKAKRILRDELLRPMTYGLCMA